MKVSDEKVWDFHVLMEVFSTINGFFSNVGFNPFEVMIRTC